MESESRKPVRHYYISLEGMTERFYFERLCELVNGASIHPYRVEFVVETANSPRRACTRLRRRAESNGDVNPVIRHIRDTESHSERKAFHAALREMRDCRMTLCYTNITFELWLILHKCRFAQSISDKRSYLKYINRFYGRSYGTLHEYKEAYNMRRMLASLTLADVTTAIENADSLMDERAKNSTPVEFCGFTYYSDNPSTTVQDFVRAVIFGGD